MIHRPSDSLHTTFLCSLPGGHFSQTSSYSTRSSCVDSWGSFIHSCDSWEDFSLWCKSERTFSTKAQIWTRVFLDLMFLVWWKAEKHHSVFGAINLSKLEPCGVCEPFNLTFSLPFNQNVALSAGGRDKNCLYDAVRFFFDRFCIDEGNLTVLTGFRGEPGSIFYIIQSQ